MQLYADEDFPLPAVEELRRLGHNVVTVQEDGRTSAPDDATTHGCTARARLTVGSCRQRKTRITPPWPRASTPPWRVWFLAAGTFASTARLDK
jgi:hypothetical protein